MTRHLLACTALLACASTAEAQSLRDRLNSLLTFGPWSVPLQVGAVSPDGSAIVANDRFLATAVGANATLQSFLNNWMTGDAASAPVASTGGGRTFRFVGGVPVETRPSPGPIFGERASTLGRGTVLAGVSYTGVEFSRLRGLPLNDVRLTFTQGGAAPATADALDLRLSLDYAMSVTALSATAGVLDRLDVGVVVPVVRARLSGQSVVRVVAGSAGASPTVIAGTPANPILTSAQSTAGTASGIGDVALRAKLNLIDRPSGGFGVLGDVRLPTGNADNLLGSGAFSARVLGVYSGRYGIAVPVVNAGYAHYASRSINDALLATVGLDAELAPWATAALAFVGQRHVGESVYRLPAGGAGALANGALANIPEIRDDALSASIGTKLDVRGARVTLNVLAPVSRGGPRPDLAYTFGIERAF